MRGGRPWKFTEQKWDPSKNGLRSVGWKNISLNRVFEFVMRCCLWAFRDVPNCLLTAQLTSKETLDL